MQMLSPRWASFRMSAASSMVADVPPPPLEVVSRGSKAEIAGLG